MQNSVEQKDAGWEEWLHKYGIFDNSLTQDQLYLRYQKFKDVTFPMVDESCWHLFMQDLVLLEAGLVFGDTIGECSILPFNFEVTNKTPIRSKPIQYPREEREWIKNYCQKMVELGVLREIVRGKDEEPLFICNAVLVKDGQSQQKFRFCGNFIPANLRIIQPAHPLGDCITALDGLQNCTILSAIDAKAGFLNVVVPLTLQTYLGVITQDAIYVFQRMPFGTNASACHFQAVMNYIFTNTPYPPRQVTYLDDCSVGGTEIMKTWQDTIIAMALMILAGIPVNIKKCQFLVSTLYLLGYILCSNHYQLGGKSIKKLFGSQLPRTKRELQALLGKLNFASLFVPQYRKRIKPILDLLSKKSSGKWEQQHTDILNQIGQCIMQRLKLGLVDTNAVTTLYIDEDGEYFTAILTQGAGEQFTICGLATREVLQTEGKLGRMERLLIAATWGYNRFGRYTYYIKEVQISFPLPAEVCIATCSQTMAPRLQAKLIELSAYQCKFTYSHSAWTILRGIEELGDEPPEPLSERNQRHIWEHEDIIIPTDTVNPETIITNITGTLLLQFDGGCASKVGTGAYVLWDQYRKLMEGGYHFYGRQCTTNNQAEMQAMVHGLQFVEATAIPADTHTLIVQGDSQLSISYMTGKAKANADHLSRLVVEAKQIVRQMKPLKVIFQHIDRCHNKWADFLCRKALSVMGDGIFRKLDYTLGDDLPTKSEVLVGFTNHQEEPHSKCKRCKLDIRESTQQCGACNKFVHYKCMNQEEYPMRRGPWHCQNCKKRLSDMYVKDITLDENLLKYLSHGELPPDQDKSASILKTSKYIHMDDEGRLWCSSIPGYGPRSVPLIGQRLPIMKEVLQQSNYANGHAVYDLIRPYYYWHGMLADCIALSTQNIPKQKVRAQFRSPPYLLPPSKGAYPFSIWCCDTIVGLQPAAPNGGTEVIVAIDPFTKWVEVGILATLDSTHTTQFLHEQIICRYGIPYAIRTDKGTEYSGQFSKYLARAGIIQRRISTMNPRANGQAERTVRNIKEGITKQLLTCPSAKWWEVLQDVARALRIVNHPATHLSPYLIVFKQQPLLPMTHIIHGGQVNQEEVCKAEVDQAITYWKEIYKEIAYNLRSNDKQMTKKYLEYQQKKNQGIMFVFEKGDPVLLKSKIPAKQKCRAVGPYTFINYVQPTGVVAQIQNSAGKIYKVCAANLIPLRTEGAKRMQKYLPGSTSARDDSSDSSLGISLGDPLALPPGVHVEPTEQTIDQHLFPTLEQASTKFFVPSRNTRSQKRKQLFQKNK